MKNNGFTLVELLAVIAILGVLVLIAVPNVIKLFNSGTNKTMQTQEANILSAANMFIDDYCVHRLSTLDNSSTPAPKCNEVVYSYYPTGDATAIPKRFVCLSVIQNKGYIDSVNYKGSNSCLGIIVYDKATNSSRFSNGKVYLKCADYLTDRDEIISLRDNYKSFDAPGPGDGSGISPAEVCLGDLTGI